MTGLSPARQGWSVGQLSLHCQGKLLPEGDRGAAWPEMSTCPRLRTGFARLEQARLEVVYDPLLPFKVFQVNRRTAITALCRSLEVV